MKKQLTLKDYKKSFDEFLASKNLLQVYNRHLQHPKENFFAVTPVEHWLVMAFNWAKIKPGEKAWKSIDLDWREVLVELRRVN